jgi:acetate kinase
MNILVLNAGSSSVKYQLFEIDSEEVIANGVVERIGMSGAVLTHRIPGRDPIKLTGEILDHQMAIEYVLSILLSKTTVSLPRARKLTQSVTALFMVAKQ